MMLTAGVGYHGVLVQRKTFEKRHDYDCGPETIPGPTAPGILNWHSFTLLKVAGTDTLSYSSATPTTGERRSLRIQSAKIKMGRRN